MSDFILFKEAVQRQFDKLSKDNLFTTNTNKYSMWETYLGSFPEGINPIFRERTEHDCQCCKQFIRAAGSVVGFIDGKKESIWDIQVGGHYQIVADALSTLVKSKNVEDIFLHYERTIGTDFNHQEKDGKILKWNHFYQKLDNRYFMHKDNIPTTLADKRSNKEVLERALKEIEIEAIETVLELIEQNSLYKGDENKKNIERLLKNKKSYDGLIDEEKENFIWHTSFLLGGASKIRNSAIGTLLVDLSEGKELDYAVTAFEKIVAPDNYKRVKTLATKGQIKKAGEKFQELGLTNSEKRRYSVIEDININNVLFADRTAKKAMNAFDELEQDVKTDVKKFNKVDEVDIDTFMKDIVPKAETLELMVENKHSGNFMSLISPVYIDSKHMFKWDNNFSWSYNGEVTDSMKERVKKAGGNISGVLRFSIQWNDGDNNQNDFDAHCIEPNRNKIYYSNKGMMHASSGMLDVDIQTPRNKVAVENITWSDINKMQEGEYHFLVHNYSHNGGATGFTAEIEYDGVIYSYSYDRELRNNEKVTVAKINFSKSSGISFTESLPNTETTKDVWGINTNRFHKVLTVMNSPNHWDGNSTGNKHLFFILEGCKNEGKTRGFYNEFLQQELTEYRKVFEMLSSKMRVEESDDQLSGLGFSSTQRNSILCKVSGSFNRVIKINF